ncbi:hypothetical protein VDG1235_742 [Verrucomicrobiia bacterium DG1235]|nr:hypothetical protein VDG1235_742 [Verrucomicrobiae bacterium DG1235]
MKVVAKIVFALGLSLSASFAYGQEAELKRFRVLGYGDGFFEGVFFERMEADEPVAVELGFMPNRKSQSYDVPESEDSVSFFRLEKGPHDSVKRVEVGRVRWPPRVERALLVFFEAEDFVETGQYEILVLDESPEVWKAGCFRFLNLSGAELNCRLGEERFVLSHDESEIYSFDPESAGVMRLQLMVPWEGKNRLIYSTRVIPDKNYAKLLVIKPPIEEGSLQVRVENLW